MPAVQMLYLEQKEQKPHKGLFRSGVPQPLSGLCVSACERSSGGFRHFRGVGVGEQQTGVHHLSRCRGHLKPHSGCLPHTIQYPPTHCTVPMPEPSTDEEPKPDTTPELIIAVEYEPHREADQVCEPATLSVPVGGLVKFVGMEWSSPPYSRC